MKKKEPFNESSTTGIAANLADRRFLGIEMEVEFLKIRIIRKNEIENRKTASQFRQKLSGFNHQKELKLFLESKAVHSKYELLLLVLSTFCYLKKMEIQVCTLRVNRFWLAI